MKKILVIEDNLDVRENIVEILELAGYEVVAAKDGTEGVKYANMHLPDLIICDVMMPELDGYGVLHILSKQAKTVDIPFIYLTAKAEKSDFRKGMNLGADDYVTKPFSHHELLEIVEIRLKKNERLKEAFDGTTVGLNAFINVARGQKELENLSKERETRTYNKRNFIYQENDLPRRLYFLASGKVKTFKTNEYGKEYITNIYNPGDFLGYLSLISNERYTESAIAIEDSEISFIPKEDFQSLLFSNRDFSAQFIKMLTNSIEEKENQLLSLAYNSIRKRVAEVLVRLYDQNDRSNTEITILREDLANLVGTAKESVIRTLTEFKKDGLVNIEHGKIQLAEIDKLRTLPY